MDRRWIVIPAVLAALVLAVLVLRACSNSEEPLPPQVTVPNPADPEAAGAITLEAVTELFAEHAAEPWAAVEHSTAVTHGAHVVLNSDPFVPAALDGESQPERDPAVPYSDAEALAACEAVIEAFAAETPQVTVEVHHADEVLVTGDAEGCTAQ